MQCARACQRSMERIPELRSSCDDEDLRHRYFQSRPPSVNPRGLRDLFAGWATNAPCTYLHGNHYLQETSLEEAAYRISCGLGPDHQGCISSASLWCVAN